MERESMDFDLIIVGGGPAGLATAIKFAQLAQAEGKDFKVCLVEKGSEIGAHIMSGAVIEPRALEELFPAWQEADGAPPLTNPVTDDSFYYLLGAKLGVRLPGWMVPKALHNKGNYAASLANLCRWLGKQAEALGVDIFPGFAANDVLFNEDGSIGGIATGDMGIDAQGERKPSWQAGYDLRGKYTVFAEGCRGHLGKQLMEKFNLCQDAATQHYGIGFKEIWEVPADQHVPGKVIHGVGWPLGHFPGQTLGGAYLYHLENQQLAIGLIVDLGYKNPHLSPFDEFQRFKHHRLICAHLKGGKRVAYGARAVVKGGLAALPKLSMPGGLLVGDNAGFLNNLKQKGTHTAMKSGMLAAEAIFDALKTDPEGGKELAQYPAKFATSWLYDELHVARNTTALMHRFGTLVGAALTWIEQTIFRGRLGLNLSYQVADHEGMHSAAKAKPLKYPKPDGVISFDKLSSVFLTNTSHAENQPCHLQLADAELPIKANLPLYDEPAQRYCPAGVYEVITVAGDKKFQINAQNCIHCKTCDIKDPAQNITWVAPEGGGGPNYSNM